MLKSPPGEKQWLSWLYVVSWTLIIFLTIPLARRIQKYVAEEWSRDLFTYVVLAAALLGFAAAAMVVRRHLSARRSSLCLADCDHRIFYCLYRKTGAAQSGRSHPFCAIRCAGNSGISRLDPPAARSHRLFCGCHYLRPDRRAR